MNRSIILAAVIVSAAILLNGYLERNGCRPRVARSSETRDPVAREKSVAVLPFEDLSSSDQNSHFADGVQDEILTNLAKIGDLKVISRSSLLPYENSKRRNVREIAKQLDVAYVVEGNVRRADSRVRVNVQLVDARTDAHLWADSYDRELTDVVAVETEIAKSIANALQAKISPAEKAAIEGDPRRP